jgi:putative hydrolase of the HAD superfamily
MIARNLPKAIGFDLGETLIYYASLPLNWQGIYPQALAHVAAVCSHNITENDIVCGEQVLARYNTRLYPRHEEVSAACILGEVLAAWKLPPVFDISLVEDAFFGFFRQTYAVYSDTIPALQTLQRLNIRVGVLTDVPYGMAKRFVAQDVAPLRSYVNVVLTSVEAGHRKPHPSGYHSLASLLDIAPSEMIYVGNEEKDIAGANAAGLFSVLIDRDGSGANFGQDRTITSLEELLL